MPKYSRNYAPRLLYLPNESKEGDQVGPRSVFDTMLKEGRLSAYEAFSLLYEANKEASREATLERWYSLAAEFQPDIVLVQHVGDFYIPKRFLAQIKQLNSRPMLVYHEGDVYGRLRKRLPKAVKAIAKEAELVFLVGLGNHATLFRRHGAQNVVHVTTFADKRRFAVDWTPTADREFDVVMVGNRITSRLPFLRMPGSTRREKLAVELSKLMGDKFAVFGSGWEKFKFARGTVPFEDQSAILRRSWITVGWNHFDRVPFYFSNRLPIALMSGVAHVTNYQPGYEKMFTDGDQLLLARSVNEAVQTVNYLLSLPREDLIRLGLRGRDFAIEQLSAEAVFSSILDRTIEVRNKKGCRTK